MNFNDLIARFRVQALGGLAVFSGHLGIYKGSGAISMGFLVAGLAVLFFFWLGAAAIDHIYYAKLLEGAVNELLHTEKVSRGWIQLSTEIERALEDKKVSNREDVRLGSTTSRRRSNRWRFLRTFGIFSHRAAAGQFWFYALPGIALFSAFVASLVMMLR